MNLDNVLPVDIQHTNPINQGLNGWINRETYLVIQALFGDEPNHLLAQECLMEIDREPSIQDTKDLVSLVLFSPEDSYFSNIDFDRKLVNWKSVRNRLIKDWFDLQGEFEPVFLDEIETSENKPKPSKDRTIHKIDYIQTDLTGNDLHLATEYTFNGHTLHWDKPKNKKDGDPIGEHTQLGLFD